MSFDRKKWRRDNADKVRLYRQRWLAKNPDWFPAYYKKNKTRYRSSETKRRLAKYGIDVNRYNEMLLEQSGQCYICNASVKLHVDHCHKSGKVRKLLCMNCNGGLGNFKDNPELLKKAIRYLHEHLIEEYYSDERAVLQDV